MFLYSTVDERGRTVVFISESETRPRRAVRIFFHRALKPHGGPRRIHLGGFEPRHSALRRMGMRNEFNFRGTNPVKIRSCQYLNNIVEQDHRRVKPRISTCSPSRHSNSHVVAGIVKPEAQEGQYGVPFDFGTTSREIWRRVLAG
jgi:putative transposase